MNLDSDKANTPDVYASKKFNIQNQFCGKQFILKMKSKHDENLELKKIISQKDKEIATLKNQLTNPPNDDSPAQGWKKVFEDTVEQPF